MKFRLMGIVLVMTLAAWSQTNGPGMTKAADSGAEKKPSCACCEKMGGMDHHKMGDEKMSSADHDKMMCADHKAMNGCCHDMKDGTSCMKGTDDKNSTGDDKAGSCAGAKGCCARMDEKDKTAMKCCGDKCERHQHSQTGGSM
jgi:uncharacterized protein involved in copper resistance